MFGLSVRVLVLPLVSGSSSLQANFKTDTVDAQVARVTARVTRSHVQTFGDVRVGTEVLASFFGAGGSPHLLSSQTPATAVSVASGDVPVCVAKHAMILASTAERRHAAEADLVAFVTERERVDAMFEQIAAGAVGASLATEALAANARQSTLANSTCHKLVVEDTARLCGSWSDYSLRYSSLLANLCDLRAAEAISQSIAMVRVDPAAIV